ncbi:MAG: HAD family phosphatase, partial [Promethearchaeota archaeon]
MRSRDYCIIFDMDGVLADTGPIHFESWVKLAEEIGVNFTRETFEQTFGQTSPEIVRKLVGPEPSQDQVEKWANLKEKYYRQMVADKLEPLPGVLDLLKILKKEGFKMAVGSSGPPENVDLLLKTLNIKSFFDAIITAEDVERGKPEPDVFLIAARQSSVKPQNCLVIEDAPVGIQAAKNAGMKCISLTTTHKKDELIEADLILED